MEPSIAQPVVKSSLPWRTWGLSSLGRGL